MKDDPWAAVRRAVYLRDYEAIASAKVPGAPESETDELGLGAAYLALAYGDVLKGDRLFGEALERLPHWPADHEAWVRVTAFAVLGGPDSYRSLEALFRRRGFIEAGVTGGLRLAACTNFLSAAAKRGGEAAAVAFLKDIDLNWGGDRQDIEIWAFRLGVLSVFAGAEDQGSRFSEAFAAYQPLLEAGNADALGHLPHFRIYVKIARTLLSSDRPALAVEYIAKAIAAGSLVGPSHTSERIGALMLKARCAILLGDHAGVRACAEDALALSHRGGDQGADVEALAELARILAKAEHPKESASILTRAVEIVASDEGLSARHAQHLQYELGMLNVRQADPAGALPLLGPIAAFGGGVSSSPRLQVPAWAAVAGLLLTELPEESAIASFRRLIRSVDRSYLERYAHSLAKLAAQAGRKKRAVLAREIAIVLVSLAESLGSVDPARALAIYSRISTVALRILKDETWGKSLVKRGIRLLEALPVPMDDRYAAELIAHGREFGIAPVPLGATSAAQDAGVQVSASPSA